MRSCHTRTVWFGSVLVLGATGLMASACKKNPEEKKAEIRADAQKDINDIRKDEVKDLNKVNKSEMAETKDAYATNADHRIDALGDRIDKVEKTVSDKDQATKDALAPLVATAKAKREAAKTQLKGLKDADANSWAAIRSNVDQAVGDLEASVQSAEQGLLAH